MENKKSKLIVSIFDICFIMILCFATLYTALLIQDPIAAINYSVNLTTLICTGTSLLILLAYIIIQSEKQLKTAFKEFYKDVIN